MSVGRYELEKIDSEDFRMVPHDHGDYVFFEDYRELTDKFEELQSNYDNLVEMITDLYRAC